MTISDDESGKNDRARMEAIEIAALASARGGYSSNEQRVYAHGWFLIKDEVMISTLAGVLSPEPFCMERREVWCPVRLIVGMQVIE